MRFFLVDRITSWDPGRRATAVKNIALSEDFFDDHFPLRPVMPGVLLLEGLAQLGGLVAEEAAKRRFGLNVKALLSIVDRAKFRALARPGDRLDYAAELVAVNESGAKAEGLATRDGAPVAECTLVFAFQTYSNPELEARRRDVLAVWMRGLKEDGDPSGTAPRPQGNRGGEGAYG
jgi:3-hydroxyacyl-[acyl-carrier-protein] dehydratase